MRSGALFEHATWERLIDASECSFLLPTPTARDHKDGANTTWHPEKGKLPHSIGALLPNDVHDSDGQDLRTVIMTGVATTKRSGDGSRCGDQLPLPEMIEDD